mgnify:CR=1 FL=1
MYRKEVNFKSIILKVFILYLGIYLLALFFRFNYDLKSVFINIEYKYLILINVFSIFLGLPLSIIFDFILIKVFGLFYILLFAPIQTFLGLIQVIFLKKINLNFTKKNFLIKNIKKNKIFNIFENINFKPIYIFIIRAFPILPFLLGSYFIAVSNNNKKTILINSLIGAYIYYFTLFIIIGKA